MKRALVGFTCLVLIGLVTAQERDEHDLGVRRVEAEFLGEIKEEKPLLPYEFDPDPDIGRVLGEEYVMDPRLDESVERIHKELISLHTGYLRKPVVLPFLDLTVEELAVKTPEFRGKPTRWELLITDSSGELFKRLSGEGSPPVYMEWNGRGTDGELITVGAVYTYTFVLTDELGNRNRLIAIPPTIDAILDRDTKGYIASIDSRGMFEGLGPQFSEGGEAYIQYIVNMLKEKNSDMITVAAHSSVQSRAIEDFISKRIPYAKMDIKKLGERFVNIDISFR